MIILALDLGTNCGWAVNSKIMAKSSGTWDLKPTRFESHGMRYMKFKRNVELEIVLNNIDFIVYEEVRNHVGVDAAHMYGGWLSALQVVCIENEIPYKGIPVGTIKKHATGKGNATKEEMVTAAIQKFKGTDVVDDNHADALHLLDYAVSQNFKL